MSRLLHRLQRGDFTVTVEIDPPRGGDVQKALTRIRRWADRVDAVNVADCPMANVRMSPIALAHLLQRDVGVEAIFHLTTRDRNVIGLQAELLGASALGVRNILCLRGDDPVRGDHPQARGVFELDAVGLVRLAATLNRGKTAGGGDLESATQFAVGVACNPGAADPERELNRLLEKVEAGANFAQTQPIWEARVLERWLHTTAGRLPIPVLYGIMPLRDAAFAEHLHRDVPGMRLPQTLIDRIRRGGEGEGVRAIAGVLRDVVSLGVAGVHLFPLNSGDRVTAMLDTLAELGLRSHATQTRA